MKKLRIFLLTLLMVFTILPVNTLADEDNSSKEPDVSVYATKTQLMDDTFAPKSGGAANNIGKIIFGNKQVKGEDNLINYVPLEWYILGQDSEIKDDEGKPINNTIIFAASPIVTGQAFEDYVANKDDPTLWIDCDYDGVVVGEIYPNHYGTSKIRKALKDMVSESNNNYFTKSEKALLQPTTVTTADAVNRDENYLEYKTTDKLYALSADAYGSSCTTIEAGSDNSTILAASSYWNSGYSFWLRSPCKGSATDVMITNNIGYVANGKINELYSIQPASNLNLTNVLFASAAKDGSLGPLDKEAPMLLRFDGSSKDVGNVSYDNDNIYVDIPGERALFVQGRNGDQNWVCSINYSSSDVISKGKILTELEEASNPVNLEDIDLSKCKIWIETKIDGLIYAVEAKKAINRVDITINDPVAGDSLTVNAKCNTTGIDSTTPAITWSPNDETVDYSKTYQASVTLTPETGYVFLNFYAPSGLLKTSAVVKDQTATSVNIATSVTINTDGSMTVTYKFLKNIDKLVNVTNPDPITVDNGTSLEDIKKQLPSSVTVETVGKSVSSLGVNWIINEITDYDPSNKNGRDLNIRGTVELPKDGSILAISNDGPATVEIQVTVKAAEIVSTPVPTSSPVIPVTDDGYVVPNTGVK